MKEWAVYGMVQALSLCTTAAAAPWLPKGLATYAIALAAGILTGSVTRWAFAGPDDPQSWRSLVGGASVAAGASVAIFGFAGVSPTVMRCYGLGWVIASCAEFWPAAKARLAQRADAKLKGP